MNFINDIQINPCPFLVKLVIRRGGDVMDAMPWGSFFECLSMTFIEFVLNYYFSFSSFLINF
jgi:hypothetical protein